MCVVENAGFGATYAAPIVSLMIEKYLRDSITDKNRLAKIDQLYHTSLIPARILAQLRQQDSADRAKTKVSPEEKGTVKLVKDSTGMEEEPDSTSEQRIRNNGQEPSPQNNDEAPQKEVAIWVRPEDLEHPMLLIPKRIMNRQLPG